MRAILSALGVLALAVSASAATLKVPQQYETIQEAVNEASEGDTIVVSKGVYYESIGVFTANLKIIGKKAVIDGTHEGGGDLTVEAVGNYDCISVYAPGVTIQGFTLRNGFNHVSIYADGCRVLKCVSRNAGYYGIYVGGFDGAEVSGNRLVGTGYNAIYASGTGAIVTKNTIRQAGSYGIQAYGMNLVIDGNNVANVTSSTGIYVSGSGSTVNRNRVANNGGDGIYVSGHDTTVTANRVSWVTNNTGIYVDGGDSLVQGNSVTVASYLVQAYGSGNRILDNRGSVSLNSNGYYIGGDDLTVTGNIVQQVTEYGTGFYIYNYGTAGNSVISNNTAEDASGTGFYLSLYGSTVSGCRAVRCGSMGYYAGFAVYGSATTFTNLIAEEAHGDGFYISASGDTFTSCTSKDATINGFRVNGTGNNFTSCGAKGTGGQGFQNQGTGTSLSGGLYLDNRIDIANAVLNGATFSGGLGGAIFETGGLTTEPEVFYFTPW